MLLSAVNPKNTLLAVAGAAAIAGTGVSTASRIVADTIFVLVATVAVGAPVVLFFAFGDRSKEPLDRLKNWMAANHAVIMAVLILVIGVKLIGDGLGAL